MEEKNKVQKVESKEKELFYDPVSDSYYELYSYPLV